MTGEVLMGTSNGKVVFMNGTLEMTDMVV